MYPTVTLQLPGWITDVVGDSEALYPTLESRMELVIRLAERNIKEGGGPFGAGVFEIASGRLIAPGVNVVVPQRCSLAHAEAVAIAVAQQICGTFDLGQNGLPTMELVTSAQPCIQCYGNLWWSGLHRVVIGARKEDVERLTGFREGPLPRNWVAHLADRPPLPPIGVVKDVLRPQACRVLAAYISQGGVLYRPGSST